jgi:hypothetical protein
MKIIITENQQELLRMYIKQLKDKLSNDSDIINFHLQNELNNMLSYVVDNSKEETINRVINNVYDNWSHKENIFTGEGTVKNLLKDIYSDVIGKEYNKLRKRYSHLMNKK